MRIETKRLVLRHFAETDAAAVMHFTNGEFETEQAALAWIHWIKKEDVISRPLFVFAIESKQTGDCIGRVYIHGKYELNGEVEIGYGIAEEHRINGYATEAAKAAVWFAFEQAGQEVLCAIVKPENIASRQVIEKIGFVSSGTRIVEDENGVDCTFDYFRFYHTDYLPGPEWDIQNLYKPEPMGDFFNKRADGYNKHMLSESGSSVEDYKKLGSHFPQTNEKVQILDIGCGTGIELDYIWEQAPNAHITCVDMSQRMLELLLKNHPESRDKICIIKASYADWEYPAEAFNMVVSSMTLHHLWQNEKTIVYRKILCTLKPGGSYIESDFIVNAVLSEQYRRRYEIITSVLPEKVKAGEYHIDIPFTVEVQRTLLLDAGFQTVEILDDNINNGNGAILKATK